METQTTITIPKSEPETVSDVVATCTKQIIGDQSVVEIDDDPFVIGDIPSSDGGWIEDLDEEVPDEEVPALRKLSDGEDEIVDDVDEESEFNYDESFLSTTDDCAEDILADLHNTSEMANGAESVGHPEVSSSPQQIAPTSDSKVASVTDEVCTENRIEEQSKSSKKKKNRRETTLQTPQLSKELENPSYVLKAKKIIDEFLKCEQAGTTKQVPMQTKVSTETNERLPLANTSETKLGDSLLPSKGVRETQSRKMRYVRSHAFVKGRNGGMRRRKQVLKPRASDIEPDTKERKKTDIETSPTKPDPISPMTRSRTRTSSQSAPSLLSNPPPKSSSTKLTVKARTKPVGGDVKGENARKGLEWKTVSTLSNNSSTSRTKTKVKSEVPEGKSLDSEEKPVRPYTVRFSGKDQNNASLESIASESPGDDTIRKQQSCSEAEDIKTSSKSSSDDIGTKKHYTSVDEYVQDLRRMMKLKGIKNMVLKGPKNVIRDVTKKLNDSDSKKVLFRLGDARTQDQKGTDSLQSPVRLKTSSLSKCLTPPSVDSKNKPSLKVDQSNAANFGGKGVLVKVPQVSEPKEQPLKSVIARTGSPPTPEVHCLNYSTPLNVGDKVNDPKTLPISQSTDVFKALSLLNLIRPPERPALPSPVPVSHAPAADHERIVHTRVEATNPAAGNTVIDSLGPAIPPSLSNGTPSTDQTGSTGLQRTTCTIGENTKTMTAGCAKVQSANIDDHPVKGNSTRVTRSMSRSHQSRMVVKSQPEPIPPPSRIHVSGKTISTYRINDSSASKQGNVLGCGAHSQTSSTLPFMIRAPGKTDESPCVPGLVSRPNAPPPLLQPKRNDIVQYIVHCPNGQRKILRVPGGIPVHVAKVLSGKPPITECKSIPSVGVGTNNPTEEKQTADTIVKVTTEILPSGIQLKRVTTTARSPQENVDGTAIRPERSKADPKEKEGVKINEFPKKDKNLVSNSDGSHVFTQTSAKTVTQPTLPENNPTEIPGASDKSVAKQVSQGSTLNGEKKGTCESEGDLMNNSLTLRRSRRERKVARPYSPPPLKRRKFTASPSSSSVGHAIISDRTFNQQLPISQTSIPTTVDLKKASEVPHSSKLSDHTKSDHMKEKGSKLDAIFPLKGLRVFIKSEPLSDDEQENSAVLCPNLAECNAIKTEPDTDSDSTDIPTDSDDNDDESCRSSAKLKGPLADTRSSEGIYQLPKISETEHLSRAEKMRLLQQRIEEQELMLENIKKQRHQFVMQRKSNPYLKDLY